MAPNIPKILQPGTFNAAQLEQFRADVAIWKAVDIYEPQLGELAEIRYPGDIAARRKFVAESAHGDLAGAWVYYPWSGVLLHCLGSAELFELRTNRNQNLITADEQASLAAAVVAVAGMSVGSGIALSCVYSGISTTIKLADFDTLETANLNRLRAGLPDVGTPKIELASRHIYELNPFAEIHAFGNGVDDGSIDAFFTGPNTTVVVDEIDDFKMKVTLRSKAKEYRIPLLMFTSLGDSILVDVERYDLDENLELFNGAIPGLGEEILKKPDITPEDAKRYAVQLVGAEYVPTRAMGSLTELGKTLVGRPQLYSTIAVDGGLSAYVIKSIVLGQPLASGRYQIRFTDLFDLPSAEFDDSDERRAVLQTLFEKSV